jgi:hypothetical protein
MMRQTVLKHALGVERFWYKQLFAYGEINERTFKVFMRKIDNQSYRVSMGMTQLRAEGEPSGTIWVERLSDLIGRLLPHDSRPAYVQEYLKVRARNIVATRVLRDLDDLDRIGFLTKSGVIEEVRKTYRAFDSQADASRIELFEKHRRELLPIDSHLANKYLALAKMRVLQELVDKGTLSQKIANTLKERIDEELFE